MTAERLRKELDEMYRESESLEYKKAITDIVPMVDMVASYENLVKKLIARKSDELYAKAMQATSKSEYDEYMTMSLAVGAVLVYFEEKDVCD